MILDPLYISLDMLEHSSSNWAVRPMDKDCEVLPSKAVSIFSDENDRGKK